MIVRRITKAAVAVIATAVAAGIALVAAAYALFALLRDPLTPAGAAGVVAVVFAVLVLLGGMIFSGGGRAKRGEAEDAGSGSSTQERLLEIARTHPLIAVGVGLAGLFVVLKRPGLLALLAANFLGATRQKRKDRRQGMV